MSKTISLLKFQLKVLKGYFKNLNWSSAKTKEFFTYLFFYILNFWYYFFLTIFEDFFLNKHPKLKAVDKKLADCYKDNNQFWVSIVESYKQQKEKIANLTYGETSYLAIKASLDFVKLSKEDTFYDLGCGIGKTVFFANVVYGAKAVGVDLISNFITNANNVVKECNLENISFIEKNIFEVPLKGGTVFYVTPTCFDVENVQKLFKSFEKLPKGSRLIVLSKNIQMPNLKQLGYQTLLYSWGKAITFYYEVI